MIECEETPALICSQCLSDLHQADLFRKRCLEAEEYFRLKIPEEFFDKSRLDEESEVTSNLSSDNKFEEIEVKVDPEAFSAQDNRRNFNQRKKETWVNTIKSIQDSYQLQFSQERSKTKRQRAGILLLAMFENVQNSKLLSNTWENQAYKN